MIDVPTAEQFRTLIAPKAVAIVGANDTTTAFTGGSLHNLVRHGYTGEIYPVNPKRDEVQGLPTYPSPADIPGEIESVIVAVRGDLVAPSLEAAMERGARSAIVIASGFGEGAAGDAGRRGRRAEFDTWLARNDVPILGPSTTGLINLFDGYVARAVTNQLPPEHVRPGPFALISQSGAANNIVYNRAHAAGVHIGLALATGVQANLTTWQAAWHVLDDPRVEVVAMLIEDLGDAAEWQAVCAKADQLGKPIVITKVGRSVAGGAAIATHTGSLAGDWKAQRAALRDAGLYTADDLDQLWELSMLLARFGHGPGRPARLGVIAFSGGEGALIADQAEAAGMSLPEVSDDFKQLVDDNLTLAGAGNPFDPTGEVIGRPDEGRRVLEGFLHEPHFDAILLSFNAQGGERESPVVTGMIEQAGEIDTPTVISWWPVANMSEAVDDRLRRAPVPAFAASHRAVAAIARWAGRRPPTELVELPEVAVPAGPVSYFEAREILGSYGVPFGPAVTARTAAEARAGADELGYPVVAKVNGDSTQHKAAANGVRLDLMDGDQVEAAARELLVGDVTEIVVERHAGRGLELIVGSVPDRTAGPMVIVGTGGSLTEDLDDVALISAGRLSVEAIRTALAGSAVGRRLVDREQAIDDIVTTMRVVAAFAAQGWSVEVNPMLWTGSSLVAVDARMEQVS